MLKLCPLKYGVVSVFTFEKPFGGCVAVVFLDSGQVNEISCELYNFLLRVTANSWENELFILFLIVFDYSQLPASYVLKKGLEDPIRSRYMHTYPQLFTNYYICYTP